ncbi:hypothetical protein F4604DRAFT_1023093 [Suillus subluteus]|nr:hypothetical protein F4604DRAFT_1023093 [Suillus subluteus]
MPLQCSGMLCHRSRNTWTQSSALPRHQMLWCELPYLYCAGMCSFLIPSNLRRSNLCKVRIAFTSSHRTVYYRAQTLYRKVRTAHRKHKLCISTCNFRLAKSITSYCKLRRQRCSTPKLHKLLGQNFYCPTFLPPSPPFFLPPHLSSPPPSSCLRITGPATLLHWFRLVSVSCVVYLKI